MKRHDLIIRGGTIVDGSGEPSFVGDIAVDNGWIVAVGEVEGDAAEEIVASGLMVTPGFVDIHTHYDGQLIWSDRLAPSSDHGVTTVMTGNCGIGFAPCRPGDRQALIELMEGVEDIPEAVTGVGLTWDWESFPEFLDAIDRRDHDIDVFAMVPHSPMRVYAMGERGIQREAATEADLQRMKELTREALDAGAAGVGTSRLHVHRTSKGELIPSFDAAETELHAIGDAMRESGKGVFQMVSSMAADALDHEMGLMRRLAEKSGRTVTYTQAQTARAPEQWRDVLTHLKQANDDGAVVKAQLLPRPVGMIIGLTASVHPFCMAPSWQRLADLPLEQKLAEMRKPEVRRALIDEQPDTPTIPIIGYSRNFSAIFELGSDIPNYEPDVEQNIVARAEAAGTSPDELVYDLLLKDEGRALLLVALGNYAQYNLDFAHTMLQDPNVVVGLGDGGAHYGMICDASYPTFMLTHWVKDRDGSRFSIEQAVHYISRKPAQVVGLDDRGLIAPGYRAHFNIIDRDRLKLLPPEIVHDLPGGGKRLHQRAQGFVATIVNGQVIARNGEPTRVHAGRLLRGAQHPIPVNDLVDGIAVAAE